MLCAHCMHVCPCRIVYLRESASGKFAMDAALLAYLVLPSSLEKEPWPLARRNSMSSFLLYKCPRRSQTTGCWRGRADRWQQLRRLFLTS